MTQEQIMLRAERPGEAPASVPVVFPALLKKEVLDHLISIRFVVLMTLCLLLIPLSVYVNLETYRRWSSDYNEQAKIEMNLRGGRGRSGLTGLRPPSPLSVFANGIETSLAKDFSLQNQQLSLGIPRSYGDPIYETFGRIDFLFVVQAVLSLIAFLFAFDAVSGEKEMGTLKLSLSNPVPRYKILLAKFIGGMTVMLTPFLLSFGLAVALLAVSGYPLFQQTIAARILLILLVSAIYVALFFLMGLLVSTRTHQSKTALIVLMFAWVVLVLGVPRLSVMTAKVIRPVDDDFVVTLRKRLQSETVQKEKGSALRQLYLDKARQKNLAKGAMMFDNADSEFVRKRNEIARPYEAKLREDLAKIGEDHQRRKQRQLDLARNLARISPASLLSYVLTDLADTGEQVKLRFLDGARQHYGAMDRLVFSKSYSDTISDGDNSWGFGGNLPGERVPDEPPRFAFTFPRTADTLARSLVDMGLLLAWSVGLFALAVLAFLKYDVR